MADAFLGEIRLLPWNFAPRGWIPCDGRLLNIQQYVTLYSLLGNRYGGNGSTTFGLPNLNGNLPIGSGQSNWGGSYVQGQTLGESNVTLTQSQMAGHTHALVASGDTASTNNPGGNDIAAGASGVGFNALPILMYASAAPDTQLAGGTLAAQGGNGSHDNIMPYLALSYCICWQGEYPQRS